MKPDFLFSWPLATILLTLAGAGLTSCQKATDTPVATTSAAPAGEKSYALKGEIISIHPEQKVLVIHHEAIPDYMPAMTMEFIVSAGDLANARPGQRIRGEMINRSDGIHLEKIWPDDKATTSALHASAQALAQDTAMRGKEAYREVGEALPDFTLLDQTGQPVSPGRFRGKQVVLNFIFSRCPIATMCPAATLRMIELQGAARTAGVTNLELVSVSLDPEYDTPGVLKEYAEARGIDTSNFSFLTGPDAAVRQLLAQLGVIREFEGPTIKHTLATVLINEQGKITYRADGSVWLVEDFIRRLKKGESARLPASP